MLGLSVTALRYVWLLLFLDPRLAVRHSDDALWPLDCGQCQGSFGDRLPFQSVSQLRFGRF